MRPEKQLEKVSQTEVVGEVLNADEIVVQSIEDQKSLLSTKPLSQDFQHALSVSTEVQSAKVDRIKKLMAEGKYEFNAEKLAVVADKMLNEPELGLGLRTKL